MAVAVAAAAVAAVVVLVTEPLAQPSLETYLLDEQRTQVKGRCTAQSARPQLLLGRRTLGPCKGRIERQDTEGSCPREREPQRPGSGHSSRPHWHSTQLSHVCVVLVHDRQTDRQRNARPKPRTTTVVVWRFFFFLMTPVVLAVMSDV